MDDSVLSRSEMSQMDDSVVKHVANNMFLPIELPQEEDHSGAQGGTFVRLVADVLAQLEMVDVVDLPGLKEAKRMMKSWGMVQQNFMDWKAVLTNIEELRPGATCALFLPMQNAGLTVSIPADHTVTLATPLATLAVFRVAASSSEVMGAPGALWGTFPGWSVTTQADRVRNASFAKQAADLANHKFEETLPQSMKAGSSHAEERDVVDARYVTEWLLGAVAGHSLITGEAGGIRRVRKKIRDVVLWKLGSRLPWRRSGEYMAVKIVLHSTLMGSLGDPDGVIAYKLIMLKVMSAFLHHNVAKLDTDLILQILSKLARRVCKLEEFVHKTGSPMNLSLRHCIQDNLNEICKLVIRVRGDVDERWRNIMKHDADASEISVDPSKLDFERDVRHSFPTAWPHLRVALSSPTSSQPNPSLYVPKCLTRNTSRGWPDLNLLRGNSDEALHDIEVWVRDVLFVEPLPSCNSEIRPETHLFNLLVKYIDRAKSFYEGDCLGSSRMILTATTIVAVLDRLAGREFPMLHEYDSGVDTSVLQFLLLPHRRDMEHVNELEDYFARRLHKRQFQISLLGEDVASPQSFSVRQAQQDPEVQKAKEQILGFARDEKRTKLEELSRAREEHGNLVRRAAARSCDRLADRDGYTSHCPSRCQKCKLNAQAANMSVTVFEFPLPEPVHLQDAVVCELVAPPSSWATLRDALYVLHRDVLGVQLEWCETKGRWRDYEPLQRWVRTPSEHPLITFGSTSKLFADSHYRSPNPGSHADEAFIKPNGFNVHLVEYSGGKLASTTTHKRSGPDHVRSLTTLDAEGPYKCLQWTVGGAFHTENEVLCKQVECPPELNLAEFHAFGTLRAGQQLQIRNIVRVIEMQTMSLSHSSVVNLISQALWETGPPGCQIEEPHLGTVWFRDSQLDLREEAFARSALERLMFLTRNLGDNWKDHLALLSTVTIGARVLAMSEPAWETAAVDTLRNCREIAEKWLKQIEVVLGGMMASPVHEIQRMRSKLVDVAAIAALTFDVDVRHLELAMKSDDDVIYWLRAVARIHDNVLLNSESSVSRFQRNLLRRVQLTALRVEKALQRHLEQHSDCLDGFVSRHYKDASQGRTERWKCYESPSESHWWTTTFKHSGEGHESTLHVDILRGSFLVNGLPVGRLPSAITSHEDYIRIFGCHVFEVQPAAAGKFVSLHELKESVFTFSLIADGNRLVVTDRRHDTHEYELFPNRFFAGDLPGLVTENYSHWILRTKSGEADARVLFRTVKFDDDHFADDVVPFEIDVGSRRVRDNQRDRNLVDIRSASFREIYDAALHRLEAPSFVHVFVDSSGHVHAELPRMGLSFDVHKEGVLWSREQPGFRVSTKQSLGTLIGLRQGLLLTEQESFPSARKCLYRPKRALIMPHTDTALSSEMHTRQEFGQQHPVVRLTGGNSFRFSSPSFFVYDVDDRLRCLRAPASQTAWLYLALLHALTAHPLPDPFTGLTGAESAMRLLQSPRCWSCKPYDSTSLSILRNIEKLSPRRNWYPEHLCCMQTVTWPKGLFPSTALDAFRLIVEKLIEGSNRCCVLFPNEGAVSTWPEEPSSLRLRSYWRSRSFLGQEAALTSSQFGRCPVIPELITMNLSQEEGNRLKEHRMMRTLAEAGFQWRSVRCEASDSFGDHLGSALLHCQLLRGATREDFWTLNQTVSAWRKRLAPGDSMADNWMDLYNLARQVGMEDRREEFTFLLSLLAFRDADHRLLFVLLCVAVHADDFESIDPPEYESYEFTEQADLDLTMVREEIEHHKISFHKWKLNGIKAKDRVQSSDAELLKTYRERQAEDVEHLVDSARRSWPNPLTSSSSWWVPTPTIEWSKACDVVNRLFTRWRRNGQLHTFVLRVSMKVDALSHRATIASKPGTMPLELPIYHLDNDIALSDYNTSPFRCELPIAPSRLSPQDYSEAEAIFQAGQLGDRSVIQCEGAKLQEAVLHDPHPSFMAADRTSACRVSELFKADLRQSWEQRHKLQARPLVGPTDNSRTQLAEKLKARLKNCQMKSSYLWKGIGDVVMPLEDDLTSCALEAAGLWRRVTPAVLLPLLVSSPADSAAGDDSWRGVRTALGALAVIWTLEQQTERCLRFSDTNDHVALEKELPALTRRGRNWKPMDRPEWLLLELEGDYMMRKVQVDVTNAMLEPKDARSAVLQLNMGEGKTSVIVPALCASISDGDQFARLTVLSSLFRVNFDALAFKLGGLLNRRVYTFPCRRDTKLNADHVDGMETAYVECIAERGVVVTRPEHRLSAQLMALELCRAGDPAAAKFRNLLDLVDGKAGDVLDESDSILQVKYQVVYTIGEQMNVDGGNLRWKVSQSVLHSARRHFRSLLEEFGSDVIEFKDEAPDQSAFPRIRLLTEAPNVRLCELIVDDVLDGRDDSDLAIRELQGGHQKLLIRNFVLDPTAASLEEIREAVPPGPLLQIVLIMRGLLCYGVLMHALRMRWRVEFGVRPSGHPKMAVPFRAKDVPVERAEYGHPDVAIMLTQLSYYNSGLSDEQLLEAFQRLHRLSSRDHEYKRWLQSDARSAHAARLPATLSDVNLDDFVQRKRILFPSLRRNMRVIDFWLSTTVFPVECKQFEGKLVASAWDLCDDKPGRRRPVCGFSGTKDTSLLLPISITQRDLPELQGTDGVVIANLLRDENRTYRSLPSHIDDVGILAKVIEHEARVLLDVGALMVDLSNREVATAWLARVPRAIEAAIYFDDGDNQIMAVDRDGHAAPLPLSPYHRKMDSCVVYLDDVHTRGTDLKIPHGYHACVTLGRGITKDCLVQACMRMRMLGAGHSVSFWASHEVHTCILSEMHPSSENVLDWVTQNSVRAIKDGFRHWGAQGITHCRRQTVNRLYDSASDGTMSLQTLGVLNAEKEIVDLVECYGNERRATPLPEIISQRLRNAAANMSDKTTMKDLGSPIIDRITEYAGSVRCSAHVLDEEQERELEHELEEEPEIQGPGAATPHVPELSLAVRGLASGSFASQSGEFLPALQALQRTVSLWQHAEMEAWSRKLYVTREFATVVSRGESCPSCSGVAFLRPVAWVVVVGHPSVEPEAVVLLSSFEANLLLPEFRRGNQGARARLHMFAPRRREGQNVMLREPSLVVPVARPTEALAIHHSAPLVAQLLAFAGNAFFASKDEEAAYCDFLGLCPRPRGNAEEDAFQRGDVGVDGFVVPEKRDVVRVRLKTACAFKTSPVGFMADLLSGRGWHGNPSSSHVGQILLMGRCARHLPDEPQDVNTRASTVTS